MPLVYVYDKIEKCRITPYLTFSNIEDFLFSLHQDIKVFQEVWVLIEPLTPKDYALIEILIALRKRYNTLSICLMLEDKKCFNKPDLRLEPIKDEMEMLDKFLMYENETDRRRIKVQFINGDF